MFKYQNKDLTIIAKKYGFLKNTCEKVLRLADILEFINNSKIKDVLVLKGGTAINLFLLDLPRLSVDADFDLDLDCVKSGMEEKRKEIFHAITGFMSLEGYHLSNKSKFTHSLDSFVYEYRTLSDSNDLLKIEINYSNRIHVLPAVISEASTSFLTNARVKRLSDNELIGSKISALITRTAVRDIYDIYNLLKSGKITDSSIIRKIAIFYIVLSADFPLNFDNLVSRAISVIKSVDYSKIRGTLIPVLQKGITVNIEEIKDCVSKELDVILKLSPDEYHFIDEFNNGKFVQSLLFPRPYAGDLSRHHMLIWRLNRITGI